MQYKLTYIYEIETISSIEQIDSTLLSFDSFISSISEYQSFRTTDLEMYREKTRELMQMEWQAVEKYQSVMDKYVNLEDQVQMIYNSFYSGTTLDDIDKAITEFKKLKETVENYNAIKTVTFGEEIYYVTVNTNVDSFINENIIFKKIKVTFTDNTTKEIEVTSSMISKKPSFENLGLTTLKIAHSFDTNLYNISLTLKISVKPDLTNARVLAQANVETDTIITDFGKSVTIYDNGYLLFKNGSYDLFQAYTLLKENVYVISKIVDYGYEQKFNDEYVVEVYTDNNEQKLRYYIPVETTLLTLSYYQSDMMITHSIEIFGTYTVPGKYIAKHTSGFNTTTILVELDMENKTLKCSLLPIKFIYPMLEDCQTYFDVFEYDETNNLTFSFKEAKKKVKEILTNSFNSIERSNLDYFKPKFNQILTELDNYQTMDLSFEQIFNQYMELYNKISGDFVTSISIEGFSAESGAFVNEGQNIEEYIKNNIKRIELKHNYSGTEYIDITTDKVKCYNFQDQTDDVTFTFENGSYRIEVEYQDTYLSIFINVMPA